MATTKQEFEDLKAAQAKSDIRQKFASGLGEVDPEVSRLTNVRLKHSSCRLFFVSCCFSYDRCPRSLFFPMCALCLLCIVIEVAHWVFAAVAGPLFECLAPESMLVVFFM